MRRAAAWGAVLPAARGSAGLAHVALCPARRATSTMLLPPPGSRVAYSVVLFLVYDSYSLQCFTPLHVKTSPIAEVLVVTSRQ